MEYINSRERLVLYRHLTGNFWKLQYRVKAKWLGYIWVTVAMCPVATMMTINQIIGHLESERARDKWISKGYEMEDESGAA